MTQDSQKEPMKLLLLGDSTVGKTCFYLRYSTGLFNSDHIATIGVDYYATTVTLPNSNIDVNIRLWDTAGQDRFRAITKNYVRGAHSAIILYDITNEKTFEGVQKWINAVKEMELNLPILLVGNKCDCDFDERQVTKEQGEAVAKEMNIAFYEASAKNDINVKEVILKMTELAYETYSEKIKKDKEFKLTQESKKKKCC